MNPAGRQSSGAVVTPADAPLAGDTVTRPDGRAYRSRKVAAYAVNDEDDLVCGIMVLGTHDIDRAKPMADRSAAAWVDGGYVAARPLAGWWRDGFSGGRRCWLDDPVKGRAGVWFREIAESGDAP